MRKIILDVRALSYIKFQVADRFEVSAQLV